MRLRECEIYYKALNDITINNWYAYQNRWIIGLIAICEVPHQVGYEIWISKSPHMPGIFMHLMNNLLCLYIV